MYFSILWHLHQPIYRDAETREYVLPWVNFHITKNYHQMASLAEEAGFPCTFNLVPCLLEQIDEYARGKASDPLQRMLEKDPGKLTPEETSRLSGFLPPGNAEARGDALQLAVLRSFFSPLLAPPTEKDALLELQGRVQGQVIPHFKRLRSAKIVELTTSAYFHPLLPLIFDLSVAGESLMPGRRFAHPEDGVKQISKGRDYFVDIFGEPPQGFWPSEGGISRAVARAVAREGYRFALTDENVLWKSLRSGPDPARLCRPHRVEGLSIFFRDSELSNLLSFEYWRWPEQDAVSHFLAKIEDRRRACPEDGICTVALDGENPWAGYRENGVPFLREFYSRLKNSPGLTPVFFGDYLDRARPQVEIDLAPGTWLGNFSKWVGSPAKNAGWEKLARIRGKCRAGNALFTAEGSDWFWWFGERNVREFNSLFEGYLRRALGSKGKAARDA